MWPLSRINACTPEAANAMGKGIDRFIVQHGSLIAVQTDAGIEVHRNFRFYLGHSALTARMDLAQRTVNVLYMFRDYAPIASVMALAVLPYELLPIRVLTTPIVDFSQFDTSFQILRCSLLVSCILNKLCYLLFYYHIGLSRVWNFQSNEVWAAPCEFIFSPLYPFPSIVSCRPRKDVGRTFELTRGV